MTAEQNTEGHVTSGVTAIHHVALACLAGHQLEIARNGASRRALGKQLGIPGKVIADIEAGARVPTLQEVIALHAGIPGLAPSALERLADLRCVPWAAAVSYVRSTAKRPTPQLMSELIASAASPTLEPAVVSWRLRRYLDDVHLRLDQSSSTPLTPSTADSAFSSPRADADIDWSAPRNSRARATQLSTRDDAHVDAFFHVVDVSGQQKVVLNGEHPLYPLLQLVLATPEPSLSHETDTHRVDAARQLVLHLLGAWSDYELSEKAGERRDAVREMRHEWGKAAKRSTRTWPTPLI